MSVKSWEILCGFNHSGVVDGKVFFDSASDEGTVVHRRTCGRRTLHGRRLLFRRRLLRSGGGFRRGGGFVYGFSRRRSRDYRR